MRILAFAGLAALLVAAVNVQAQPRDKHEESAEDWAWTQIRDDKIADFNTRDGCNGSLKPYVIEGWENPCRQVSAAFLVRILTGRRRDELPRPRVRLRGAHVTGDIILTDAEVKPEVWIDQSRIAGGLFLADSHWERLLSLEGSLLLGDLSGWRMRADSNVLLDNDSIFNGSVNLSGAKIGGELVLSGSSFNKGFDGNRLVVDSSLFMKGGARFSGEVDLVSAKIGSNLEMGDSLYTEPVAAGSLIVTQNLLMGDGAHFHGGLVLLGASVGGALDMTSSLFDAPVMADRLKIGGSLFMRSGATFRSEVSLIGAKIGGNLDLRGAVAAGIDLSEADATEFLVAGLRWWCPGGRTPNANPAGSIAGDDELPLFWPLGNQVWPEARCRSVHPADPPKLMLRNFHVASFQDDPDGWPPDIDLQGFHYDRLGGLGGGGKDDLAKRTQDEWKDWLARNRDFSVQPYVELSSVLGVAGQRDAADAIQFAARNGERDEACGDGDAQKCAWLSVLSAVAGYGIGSYTFRVLYYVLGFTGLGAVILCFSPNARQHSLAWRTGASLHRLLPIIELYKEFTDFFENPPAKGFQPRNLKPWQVFYFAVHAIVGWALGLILLAAMSGITQKG
jgi:hypothetical protein